MLTFANPPCHRCNHFREHKFWAPVYKFCVKQLGDQAYKARMIYVKRRLADATAELDAAVNDIAKKAAEEKLKYINSKKISHFDFLEGVAAYHLIKVRS